MMNIGEKIREARLAKGITQEELGALIGVQKSAVAKYENGRVVNIKRSTLKKLSDVLGIPPYELVIETDPKEAAELHAKVLMDSSLMEMIEEYYALDAASQAVVKRLVHGLAAEKKGQ